jgi:hypothetical protein
LPEQWPVDEYPDADPFLPWIHDVFPTDDGKLIQFVAQNKRRCLSLGIWPTAGSHCQIVGNAAENNKGMR